NRFSLAVWGIRQRYPYLGSIPRGHLPSRGKDPEFTCHQHIGRVGSTTGLGADPETEAAYQEWENRKQLEAIEQCLSQIQLLLNKVMPENK
ncbi:MAG: hypothetical protein RMY30_038555, partial [Nostoc sp. CmiSLP01]|nr:hypothetical protein [Nostoc sp. CmiSLP01]